LQKYTATARGPIVAIGRILPPRYASVPAKNSVQNTPRHGARVRPAA